MISVEEHQQQILDSIAPQRVVNLPLMDCLGLAAAQPVTSGIDLPRFDNASHDGYAVRAVDIVGATESAPIYLPVVGMIGAGAASLSAIAPGTAAKIMTGAPMPAGADAVVPYEWTDAGTSTVKISRAPAVGGHVRPAAQDVRAGDLVVERGTLLGPRHLGLLAGVGCAQVAVRPRPRVVVISTGSELREPGQELGHDSIYDANSFLLAAMVRRAGAVAFRVGIVKDSVDDFTAELSDQLVRADLVITSGGVSMGDFDVVKAALAPLGVWFGAVNMQPGKPQGFGHVGDGRVPIFALPGNPVSAFVSFELFVRPALRRLMGVGPEVVPYQRGRITTDLGSFDGRRPQFMRGEYVDTPTGRTVSPVGGAASHMLGDLPGANCLIVVPTGGLLAGSECEIVVLTDGEGGG
ncbi:MAG: molybdotransferase-like divisome protein Glp [Nocardioides sp.]